MSGIRRYRAEGYRCPPDWLLWLAAGMLTGSIIGALGAAHAPGPVLRWSYVGHLAALDLLLIARSVPSRDSGDAAQAIPAIGVSALLCVILTIMPTSVFAACIYWRAGQLPSWSILLAIIVGLWAPILVPAWPLILSAPPCAVFWCSW